MSCFLTGWFPFLQLIQLNAASSGFDYNPKNERMTETTTTRNTQLPSQAAATRAVSGSPEFHFWIE